jgi:hypothetical protein
VSEYVRLDEQRCPDCGREIRYVLEGDFERACDAIPGSSSPGRKHVCSGHSDRMSLEPFVEDGPKATAEGFSERPRGLSVGEKRKIEAL